MTGPLDPNNKTQDAVTTPVGVTTLCPQCGASMPAFETRCSACGHHKATGGDEEQRENLRRRLQAGIGDAFELLEMLGKGGMGVVFRAREKSLERDVALKVLAFDPMLVPEAFARFEREAKLAARLDHPHIVPIFAVGQGNGIAYYTMRIVRGGSLEDLLAKEKKLDSARAVRYLKEIAAALDHAHSHNVVHRDVKPANVMLGDGDHVFVADFGIARAVGGDGGALTSTGVVGSPAYMAPEQWQGQSIDGKADQYALGILAYEILTGNRPYRDATMHELLRLHLTEDLPDITQSLPSVSPAARDALRKATAKEPKDRYATTSAFATALEKALILPPTRATPVIAARAVPAKKEKAGAGRFVAAGVTIAVLGVGAYTYWNSNTAKQVVAPVVPESIVIHDTIRAKGLTDTLVVTKPAKPDTIFVAPPPSPVNGATNTGGGTVTGGPPVSGAAGVRGTTAAAVGARGATAGMGFIMVAHPLLAQGQARIDSSVTYIGGGRPTVVAVPPGPHIVTFTSAGQRTLPPRYTPMVRAGDTVKVMFVPAQGGGAQGDSLRAQVQERMQRAQQNLQRGARGRGGRGGRGSDTLSFR